MSSVTKLQTLVAICFFIPQVVCADLLPTSLTCRSNAKSGRDHVTSADRWEGPMNDITNPFEIKTRHKNSQKKENEFFSLTDQVIFSSLDSTAPRVRYVKTNSIGNNQLEIKGNVISVDDNVIFFSWTGHASKASLASIDRLNAKAIISHHYNGYTTHGVNTETFDCE